MRDYSNIPTIQWREPESLMRVKAQVRHQEPVIIEMPEHFQFDAGDSVAECKRDESGDCIYDCAPESVLSELASRNHMPALRDLAAICVESGSRLDLDGSNRRLIIHD